MTKIIIKYENEIERIKIIEILAKGLKLGTLGKAHKSGKYYRFYIEILD